MFTIREVVSPWMLVGRGWREGKAGQFGPSRRGGTFSWTPWRGFQGEGQSSVDARKRTSSHADDGLEGGEAHSFKKIFIAIHASASLYATSLFKRGRQRR